MEIDHVMEEGLQVVVVTMRLYHCTVCDLWFEVEIDALRARPARCPGCGEHDGVVPFDERRVVLCDDDTTTRRRNARRRRRRA